MGHATGIILPTNQLDAVQPVALSRVEGLPLTGHACQPAPVSPPADSTRPLTSTESLVARRDDSRLLAPSAASDRRGAHRWSPLEVPWVSSVRLTAGESAELINVSSSGVLVRTRTRPPMALLTRLGLEGGPALGLAFELTSGQRLRVAGRVVRCSVASMANGPMLYVVAARFDDPLSFDLPHAPLEETAPGLRAVFDYPVRLQNEWLERLADRASLPSAVCEAISDLILINTALVRIACELRDAHGAQLPELARRHRSRVKDLRALRHELVEHLSTWNGMCAADPM